MVKLVSSYKDIVTVPITHSMHELATERCGLMGELNNSIRTGGGNLIGAIGVVAVERYMDALFVDHYDYDLLWNLVKLEVKSKETKVFPDIDYDCSVACSNLNQKCDIYIFTRVHKDHDYAYICGFLTKDDFRDKSRRLYKGMQDGSNGYVCHQDCDNVYVRECMPIHKLLNSPEAK